MAHDVTVNCIQSPAVNAVCHPDNVVPLPTCAVDNAICSDASMAVNVAEVAAADDVVMEHVPDASALTYHPLIVQFQGTRSFMVAAAPAAVDVDAKNPQIAEVDCPIYIPFVTVAALPVQARATVDVPTFTSCRSTTAFVIVFAA